MLKMMEWIGEGGGGNAKKFSMWVANCSMLSNSSGGNSKFVVVFFTFFLLLSSDLSILYLLSFLVICLLSLYV